MWVNKRDVEALRSDITALQTSASFKQVGELLERLESLERRFADLHMLLTTTSQTGRPKLTETGKNLRQIFMFGGPSPGYVAPATPTTPRQ